MQFVQFMRFVVNFYYFCEKFGTKTHIAIHVEPVE